MQWYFDKGKNFYGASCSNDGIICRVARYNKYVLTNCLSIFYITLYNSWLFD